MGVACVGLGCLLVLLLGGLAGALLFRREISKSWFRILVSILVHVMYVEMWYQYHTRPGTSTVALAY